MKINYKKLGKRIQSARRETGLSQEQLAEAIGKSPSAVSTIETGKRGASLETLIRIANALQVSADYLLADQLPHIPWEPWGVFNPSFFTVQIGQNLLFRGVTGTIQSFAQAGVGV